MKLILRSQSIGLAAFALGVSIFLSRILGLVREKIISYYFGSGAEADVYFAAFVVPDYISYLLAGGYFSITLVPLLANIFSENEEDGWRFFSTAITWTTIAITILCAAAWLYAPVLAHIAAPGFGPAEVERLTLFLRIILPGQIFFLPGACFTALLYYRGQFTIPALTPLVYNSSIILFGVLFIWLFPEKGMEGFCWGVLFGAIVGSFMLPMWAAYQGGCFYSIRFSHPYMKKLLLLALPLMLGQSIATLDEQFIRMFGSLTGEGGVSLLSYARRIVHVPIGVIAQAAGLASFPFLASLAAKKDYDGVNNNLHSTAKTAILIALPVSFWMMLEAVPTMHLIFKQGSFTAIDAKESGTLLMIMLLSVVFWTIQQIFSRAFYAFQNTITPTIIGTIATFASIPMYIYASKTYGAIGAASTSSFIIAVYAMLLVIVWCKKYGAKAFTGLGMITLLCMAFCVPALAASYGVGYMLAPWLSSYGLLGVAIHIAISGCVFFVLYVGVTYTMAPALCQPLVSFFSKVLQRVKKTKKVSAT